MRTNGGGHHGDWYRWKHMIANSNHSGIAWPRISSATMTAIAIACPEEGQQGVDGSNLVERKGKESKAICLAWGTNLWIFSTESSLAQRYSSGITAECSTLGGLKCTYPIQKIIGPSLCGLKLITEGINQYRIYVWSFCSMAWYILEWHGRSSNSICKTYTHASWLLFIRKGYHVGSVIFIALKLMKACHKN